MSFTEKLIALPSGVKVKPNALPKEVEKEKTLAQIEKALQELGDGRWVPWEAIAGYVRSDSRAPGLARLIQRWAQRADDVWRGFFDHAVGGNAHRSVFELPEE